MEPWEQEVLLSIVLPAMLASNGLWALIESVYGETEAK